MKDLKGLGLAWDFVDVLIRVATVVGSGGR